MILSALVLLFDQALKTVVRALPAGSVLSSAGPLLEIYRVSNTGASFGLLQSMPALVLALSLILCAVTVLGIFLVKNPYQKLMAGIALGGALGNVLDRIRFGEVCDFIRLKLFPQMVFNFADLCIVLAGIAWILIEMIGENHGNHPDTSGRA